MNTVYRQLSEAEIEDISSRILFEDNHFLIFNKRSGEIVQGDKTGDEPLSETLKAFISQRDKKAGQVFMGVAHRLDRPVSGAVIFAKTSKGLERINAMLRAGEVHKTYWALVQKNDSLSEISSVSNEGWIELKNYLYRDEKKNKSYVYRGAGRPASGYKEAVLLYRVVKILDNYILLEIKLLTGRHHQIRCQLSAIGCPIKGDLKYGARRSNKDGSICLHAREIEFIHPIGRKDAKGNATGKETLLSIEAPLLGDIKKCVEKVIDT